jgi:hypothetical protein
MYTPNAQAQSAILSLWMYNKEYHPSHECEDNNSNDVHYGYSTGLFDDEEDDFFNDED